jgi:cation diffusion facilitator CzcD-associated flavoprotein CzcO
VTTCDVAIVGAGPYGLSIAAYLKERRLDFRIFGHPMLTWQERMPKGMRLKSEGFASSLYDPEAVFSLASYCSSKGLPYADIGLPVPLETFISYGLAFQQRFVPEVENMAVTRIARTSAGFRLSIEGGSVVSAKEVVIAVGLTYYDFVPAVLASLPKELVSHSSAHTTVDGFRGRKIAVVGAGASALDLAAELHDAGAAVEIVCRQPSVRIHDAPDPNPPSVLARIRSPITPIGNGWKSFLCSYAPLLFRRMPERFRFAKVRQIAGPAGGWFIRERVVGKVPFNVGVDIASAGVEGSQARLDLEDGTTRRTVLADHVIAATGFRVDLRRLTFLDSALQSEIRAAEHTPVLSSNFESSVPGLYFVGTSAANTFGPLLRFACGARFTAQRLSRHLAKPTSRARASDVSFPRGA